MMSKMWRIWQDHGWTPLEDRRIVVTKVNTGMTHLVKQDPTLFEFGDPLGDVDSLILTIPATDCEFQPLGRVPIDLISHLFLGEELDVNRMVSKVDDIGDRPVSVLQIDLNVSPRNDDV